MKYIATLKTLLISATALLVSSAISALSLPEVSPYVGADANWQLLHTKANGQSIKHNEYMPKLNVYGGAKVNENARVEIGTVIQKSKTISGSKLRKSNAHITVIGTYPVQQDLNLIGGIGLTRANLTYLQPTAKKSIVRTAPRLIGGAEYALGSNVNVRGTVAYHMTHTLKVNGIKPRDSYLMGVGLNYAF